MAEPQIRPMCLADLAQVLRLDAEQFSHPWGEQAFTRSLSSGHLCWVLELDSRVVGYLVCSHGGGEADLLQIAVGGGYQRRGYARLMLSALLSRLTASRVCDLFLEVRAGNQTAIACYSACGFTPVGVRRSYYEAADGREDAVMMKRSLVSSRAD